MTSVNISNVFHGTQSNSDNRLSTLRFLVEQKLIVLCAVNFQLIGLDFQDMKISKWSLKDRDNVPELKLLSLLFE